MRVRCPQGNHWIDLADDSLGVRVRCPYCDFLFIVEQRDCDGGSEQIQAATPDVMSSREAKDLGERIYDGLPPLSVMMALRKQKGQGYDANDLKLEMTADDWKALAAYESVLRAAYALRTSVLVAAVALVCNVPQLAFSTDTSIRRGDAITATVLVLVIVSLTVLWLGSLSLEKIRLSGLVDFLVMTVLGVGLAFAAATAFGVYRLTALRSESSDGFWIVVAIPFALIALFDLAKTGIWVCRALGQVEPPEITNRLTEALKYLE